MTDNQAKKVAIEQVTSAKIRDDVLYTRRSFGWAAFVDGMPDTGIRLVRQKPKRRKKAKKR